ncbi:MAG: hypothetical protein ACLTC4_16390 [Hungatella hathewayi]
MEAEHRSQEQGNIESGALEPENGSNGGSGTPGTEKGIWRMAVRSWRRRLVIGRMTGSS